MSSQEDNVDVSEEVKRLVSEIITKNNFDKTCTVKYYPGSQSGDGFSTKTYLVEISDDATTLNIFLKCALNLEAVTTASTIYANETYFYKIVYPAYTEFWKSKGIKDGFRNVPASYGFGETKGSEILALENLRKKGFTLFDKFTFMNDEHLKLTLRSFAKFHAVSFAVKDQRKDLHDEFSERCPNLLLDDETSAKLSSNTIKAFIEKLNPSEDKDIIERCHNLDSKVYDSIKNLKDVLTDFSIFIKGDCWVNNMMVLYENDDREHPKDVMLIDWQFVTCSSPVMDIQALFYSVASKETVDNYKHYLDIYYEELSNNIKELGSDPEVLYPRSVFNREWIDCGLYAVGLSLALIKVMLSQAEDAPNLENATKDGDVTNLFVNMKHDEAACLLRSKYIVRHMIDIGII